MLIRLVNNDIVQLSSTQTLTNKTLSSPTITLAVLTSVPAAGTVGEIVLVIDGNNPAALYVYTGTMLGWTAL
jgi:hypothetical protein